MKAILEQLKANPEQVANKKVWVYWGGRHAKDIYWQPELSLPAVFFVPVLSRPNDSWTGRTGYVQDVLEHDGIDLADAAVYACGSEHMIHAAKEKLVTLGLPRKNFYSDAFVSSN